MILFGIVAGGVSFIQWLSFRDRLADWWIIGNVAAGTILGLLHKYLFNSVSSWSHPQLLPLLVIWLTGNFVVGLVLIRRSPEEANNFTTRFPAKAPTESIERAERPNLFFILLSLSLLLFVLFTFTTALSQTSAADILWILLGIASLLTSIAFILTKDMPRNFGFITLAISWFLNGIIIELLYFNSNFPQSSFTFPALLSLLSAIFFISQSETRKNFRFIMLSGYLIALSIAQITIYIESITTTFSDIAALFALVAAFFFFRGK